MSDAASGRKLPTRAVAPAYVRACEGPVSAWDERWHQAAKELRRTAADPPYPGLAAFGPGDTGPFFGREDALTLAGHEVTGGSTATLVSTAEAALYRGGLLTEATTWAQRPEALPNARERRFLDAGSRHRQTE